MRVIWKYPLEVQDAVRVEMPARFGVAIVVPDFVLPTVEARAVLPDCYSREDAIFNVQRAALLIAALATGTVSAFPTPLEDRFHQSYRAHLVPGLADVLQLRAPGLLGSALRNLDFEKLDAISGDGGGEGIQRTGGIGLQGCVRVREPGATRTCGLQEAE